MRYDKEFDQIPAIAFDCVQEENTRTRVKEDIFGFLGLERV